MRILTAVGFLLVLYTSTGRTAEGGQPQAL